MQNTSIKNVQLPLNLYNDLISLKTKFHTDIVEIINILVKNALNQDIFSLSQKNISESGLFFNKAEDEFLNIEEKGNLVNFFKQSPLSGVNIDLETERNSKAAKNVETKKKLRKFEAIRINTKGFHFNREEANER